MKTCLENTLAQNKNFQQLHDEPQSLTVTVQIYNNMPRLAVSLTQWTVENLDCFNYVKHDFYLLCLQAPTIH